MLSENLLLLRKKPLTDKVSTEGEDEHAKNKNKLTHISLGSRAMRRPVQEVVIDEVC